MHACYHGASLRLCAILFPFTWQHVYIPILPARLLDILQARHVTPHLSPHIPHILSPRLLDILQAPVPFLMGIDEEVLALAERQNLIPNEVVQVDLDQNAIMCDGDTKPRAATHHHHHHHHHHPAQGFDRRYLRGCPPHHSGGVLRT